MTREHLILESQGVRSRMADLMADVCHELYVHCDFWPNMVTAIVKVIMDDMVIRRTRNCIKLGIDIVVGEVAEKVKRGNVVTIANMYATAHGLQKRLGPADPSCDMRRVFHDLILLILNGQVIIEAHNYPPTAQELCEAQPMKAKIGRAHV